MAQDLIPTTTCSECSALTERDAPHACPVRLARRDHAIMAARAQREQATRERDGHRLGILARLRRS